MRRHHIDQEDLSYEGYCRDCGHFVRTIVQDCGIGPYEFWGARGVHHDYRAVCPLCEGEVDGGASQPCHVCRHYEVEDNFECELDLAAGGFPGPDKLDRGDTCSFFEPQD